MKNEFIEYMSTFTKLSKEEEQLMIDSYPIRTYKKGDFLLKEGQIQRDAFLILKGSVRKHCIVDGIDKTIEFYTAKQVAIDFKSIANQKPSINYLSCLEDAVIVIINSEKEEAFYKRFPRFEEISRIETTKMMGENQELLSIFITSSPEERYKHILKNRPNLLQIAAQHQIASYIGVTPESLSRIRKRILQ